MPIKKYPLDRRNQAGFESQADYRAVSIRDPEQITYSIGGAAYIGKSVVEEALRPPRTIQSETVHYPIEEAN